MKHPDLGAKILQGGVQFTVWAPHSESVQVKIFDGDRSSTHPMSALKRGYYEVVVEGASEKVRYLYLLDGAKERPDPVSSFQPEGVHGPSQVVSSDFDWTDSSWLGLAMKDYIFYELHIGTFTPQGTLDEVSKKIPYLKKLCVNCLELMPVAQCAGKRNWGYDGVGLFAVSAAYGGPLALKTLVNQCHESGLAVCLDVVYNHLGPEGNYLEDFGPYFTEKYKTPWGKAMNYDDVDSEAVRHFVVQNALYWVREFHVDALRLDAVQGIHDESSPHILEEIKSAVEEEALKQNRQVMVIAESDMNKARIVASRVSAGYGLDAQWSDDFHHAAHRTLTGENTGYYQDYEEVSDIARALHEGFVYQGKYSPFRQKPWGESARDLSGEKFVVCIQNHDQIGNRALGDRLSQLVSFESQKLAAALLILSPYVPLIFMGQEYGETNPFQYFIDHGDPDLVKRVCEGREREFAAFGRKKIPDPKSPNTFKRSKLDWKTLKKKPHQHLFLLYQDLIALRRERIHLGEIDRRQITVDYDQEARWLMWIYALPSRKKLAAFFSFADKRLPFPSTFPSGKTFHPLLSTADQKYGGSHKKSRDMLEPQSAMIGELV